MQSEPTHSPTLPDDEDGYVPAPGAPSQARPEYDGEPSFRQETDYPAPGEPTLKQANTDDVEPAPDGSDEQVDRVEDTQGAPGTKAQEQASEIAKPPTSGKGSGKDEWLAYAKSLGHTDEQLEGLTYDELVAMFSNT